MKYKEFVDWCNERACDGCWDMETATLCLNVITTMKSVPFWRRKKLWTAIKNDLEIDVYSTNEKNQRNDRKRGGRMTAKEVLHNIEKQREEAGIAFLGHIYLEVPEYWKVTEALEKQIARKPDYEDNDAKCPVCGHEFENNVNDWGCSFCQDCGQALDWSDEE